MNKPSARFWIHYRDGMVKITLKPGQTIRFRDGGATDEGYSHWSESYEYDDHDDVIIAEFTRWGRDCDGGYRWYSDYYAKIGELSAEPERSINLGKGWRGEAIIFQVPPTPKWMDKSKWQRDYFAEAMGY